MSNTQSSHTKMIKNYTLACNNRAFALRAAEKCLATSRSVSQCRKRRMRQPRVLVGSGPHVAPSVACPPEVVPRVAETITTKDKAIRWFWETHYVSHGFYYKPRTQPVEQKRIAALEPDLADVSVDDLLLGLRLKSAEFKPWGPVAEILADPPQSVLPKEIELVTDDYGLSTCPTHYLAVYAPAVSRKKNPRVVRIFPAQGFLVALFCSGVRFPPSRKPQVTPVGQEEVPEGSASSRTILINTTALRLPVAHVCVPEPAVFPILLTYFHKYNSAEFMTSLVKEWVPRPVNMTMEAYRLHYAAHLAAHHSPYMIYAHLLDIRATWRNMMALGISLEELWSAVYLMWFVALRARDMQQLKPAIYVGPDESPDESQSESRDWTASLFRVA
ncbi:hypothetical protein BC835DRAFT_1410843 [Cytidiella melzeri]|nr:hypothetical protein BC835DRAFT_1410843 [Cytidiella melzeri]